MWGAGFNLAGRQAIEKGLTMARGSDARQPDAAGTDAEGFAGAVAQSCDPMPIRDTCSETTKAATRSLQLSSALLDTKLGSEVFAAWIRPAAPGGVSGTRKCLNANESRCVCPSTAQTRSFQVGERAVLWPS